MKLKIIGICGILVIAILIYYSYNPERYALFPKCPFLSLTGLQCPGCGSQRAIHALLHADVLTAVRNNALLVFSIPILAILAYAEYNRERKPQFYAKCHQTKYTLCYCFILILWWIGRNVITF